MVVVKKKKGESEDRLISRFRKASSRLISEYRDKARYEKPAKKRYEDKKRVRYIQQLEKERNA